MSASPTYLTGTALPMSPPEFSGDAAGVDAKVWLKRFERYCLISNIDSTLARKVTYFETFLIGAAEDWFATLPEDVRTNYDSLKTAFLAQYAGLSQPEETPASRYQLYLAAVRNKKTVEDLRDGDAWRKWLSDVLILSNKVDTRYAPEELKTADFWASLPSELKTHLGPQPSTVLNAVNACRSLPITVYDEIIAEHDAALKREKDLESRLTSRYDASQAELIRLLNNLRRQNALPPSPPEEKRARFDTPNGTSILPRPRAPSTDVSKIPQYSFTDDEEGHRQYEEALKKYHQEHSRVNISPPAWWAYPITPGTEKPGTGTGKHLRPANLGDPPRSAVDATTGLITASHYTCTTDNLNHTLESTQTLLPSSNPSPKSCGSHFVFDQPDPVLSTRCTTELCKPAQVAFEVSDSSPTSHVRQEQPSSPTVSARKGVPPLAGAGTAKGTMPPSIAEGRVSLPTDQEGGCTLADDVRGKSTLLDVQCSRSDSFRSDSTVPVSFLQTSSVLPTRSPFPSSGKGDFIGDNQSDAMRSKIHETSIASKELLTSSVSATSTTTTAIVNTESTSSESAAEAKVGQIARSPSPMTPPPPAFPLSKPSVPSPKSTPATRGRTKRPKVDLRSLRDRAYQHRSHFFSLQVQLHHPTDEELTCEALAGLDEGAMVNVMSASMAASLDLELVPTDIYLRMANGQAVQSHGRVKVHASVQDIDLKYTVPVEVEFEVMPSSAERLLLGRPWKVKAGALHFYELDVMFLPQNDRSSVFRHWSRIIPKYLHGSGQYFPETPMEAVRLLIARHPYANVAELEILCNESTISDVASLNIYDEDLTQEIEDTCDDHIDLVPDLEEFVDMTTRSAHSVHFDIPVEQHELEKLQHRLPVVDNDPSYIDRRSRIRQTFRPYRVSGKADDDSKERAERVVQALVARFGNVGTGAQRRHLIDLLRAKHLAFAESTAECKQNRMVICDPILTRPPPVTKKRSGIQALSPPQKEFLHAKIRELMDHGFMVKVPPDEVLWVSETRIVPKPTSEIDSNVSLDELRLQANAALKAAGLEYDKSLPPPAPSTIDTTTTKAAESRYRLVHNYAPINSYMKDTSFIPGDIEVKATKLSGKQFLFKGDGCAGFFIMANSRLATLLSVTYVEDFGFVGYTVMPFGFKVGPTLYYRFITTAFGDIFDRDSDFWMDDVATGHQDFDAYFLWLRTFLDRAIDTGFTLSVQKCQFMHENITFCGQLVGKDGIRADPARLKAILNWPVPKTVRDIMVFRGVCSYLRSKVPNFAKVFAPLDTLTTNVDNYDAKLDKRWTKEYNDAFLRVKNALVNARVLKEPRYDRPFVVQSDWSAEGIGAVLLQEHTMQKGSDGQWFLISDPQPSSPDKSHQRQVVFPIAYASKKCSPSESRYSAHLGELVAAKFALTRFAPFTFGQPIILVTDCMALRDILRSDKMPAAHARWREQLLAHNIIKVEHCAGRRHGLAHGLSHRPYTDDEVDDAHENVLPDDRDLLACDLNLVLSDVQPAGSSDLSPLAFDLPESAQRLAERYLTVDEEAGPLLKRFEGDELEPVIRFLLLLEMPSTTAQRDKVKRMRRYKLIDGKLSYVQDDKILDAIPRKEGYDRLVKAHELAHMGVNMLQNVNWPRLYSDARQVVKTCKTCQLYGLRNRSVLDPIIVSSPMETWAMDFVSLPTSHGKSKLLVIVDYFSRFLWAFPLAQARGQDVVRCLTTLRDHLAVLPKTIISDGGSHFDCAEVYDFLDDNDVGHHITPAYAPWVNGLVERNNGLIIQGLRKLCASATSASSTRFPWLDQLSAVIRELNTRPIPDLSNLSPTELLFGYVLKDRESSRVESPTTNEVHLQRAFIDTRRVDALSTYEAAQAKRTEKSRPRRLGTPIEIGDLVLRHQTVYESTYSTQAKLAPKWMGPYVVMKKQRKSYIIRSLVDGAEERVHLDRLKKYWPSTDIDPMPPTSADDIPTRQDPDEIVSSVLVAEDELRLAEVNLVY
ncbi:uncharacterized protein UTRI_06617 [Ustilago trichophora]|uniref:RNA-directed DNA polymerase n=1 Tax=Ustilago trichophora TaxID=86804 RepID=A0A5C3EP12_9BASI|nr:uncharacterized protein UTRI_06617 [Ustilago trichophora]